MSARRTRDVVTQLVPMVGVLVHGGRGGQAGSPAEDRLVIVEWAEFAAGGQ